MKDFSFLTNPHPQYIENMDQDFVKDPASVDPELKKFFEALWELLGKTPKWWAWVDLILDQLLMGLLKVLGGILGFDIGRLAEEMSMDEVHSLRERSVLRAARGEGSEES